MLKETDWPFLMTISNDQLWKLGGIKNKFKLIILFTGYYYRFLASTINSILLQKNLEFGKPPPSISPAKFSLSFKEQSKLMMSKEVFLVEHSAHLQLILD